MTKFTMVVALMDPGTLFKAMKPPAEGVCPFGPPFGPTTTTTTAPPTTKSPTSKSTAAPTTTATMASPSGAFLDDAALSAG